MHAPLLRSTELRDLETRHAAARPPLMERAGRADTLSLPMIVGEGGMQGRPVEMPGTGGWALTFEKMSVEAGTIDVTLVEALD